MGTVTIAGVAPDPEIYGANLAAAITYITARYGPAYTAWIALSSDDKGRTLVSATSYMDRLGLVDAGVAIAHSTVLVPVISACFELAVLIADDPDLIAALDASSNIKSVDAGGAGVEFFNPTSSLDGSASTLPYVVQQLLGPYLPALTATVIGGYGQSGDCPCDDDDDLSRSGPY